MTPNDATVSFMNHLIAWSCAALFLAAAVAGRMVRGKWVNLLTAFSGFYGLTVAMANMRLYGINLGSPKTYIIMMLGIFAFGSGYILVVGYYQYTLGKIAFESFYSPPPMLVPKRDRSVRTTVAVVLLIVVFLYSLYRLYILYTLLRAGYSYQMVRTIYFNAEYSFDKDMAARVGRNPLDIYMIQPLLIGVFFLACINLFSDAFGFSKKRTLLYWIMSFLSIAITAVSNGGRDIIFYTVFVFAYSFLAMRPLKKILPKPILPTKQKKMVIRFGVLAIAAMVVVSIVRASSKKSAPGQDDSGLFRTFYIYFTGYLPNFSVRLDMMKDDEYTHGFTFLLGLIKFPMAVIKRVIHFDSPAAYTLADTLTSRLQKRVSIGGGNMFNAYTSPFYYFYVDFGYISVFIESMLFGVTCAISEVRFERKKTAYHTFMYLFCFYLIISSMVRWEMVHPKTAMLLYFVPVIFKLSRKDRDYI